jgi:hypothetical protein
MSELEQLKYRLFILEMAERWEPEDYKIVQELRNKIWKLEHPNQKLEDRKYFI